MELGQTQEKSLLKALATPLVLPLIIGTGVAVSALAMPVVGRAEEPGCIAVSGSITGNITGPGAVLGTVTGGLEGATAATITEQQGQADGKVQLKLKHVFVTKTRDSLQTTDTATWVPIPGRSGAYQMTTQYTVTGGTGRFANAKGTLENHGEADTNRGLVTLAYSGQICGVKP